MEQPQRSTIWSLVSLPSVLRCMFSAARQPCAVERLRLGAELRKDKKKIVQFLSESQLGAGIDYYDMTPQSR
jgi:hypothetical protein